MAILEAVIYAGIIADQALQAKLARYNNKPAVFEKQMAMTEDAAWDTAMHYPACAYLVHTNEDPARGITGTLEVDVSFRIGQWTDQNAQAVLSAILDGAIIQTSDGPYACLWNREEHYTEDDGHVEGTTLSYDLVLLPSQATGSPDPIAGLYTVTKGILGENAATYLDTTASSGILHPSDTKPAIYWQLARITSRERIYAGTWVEGQFICHIIAPSATARLQFGRTLAQLATMSRIKYGTGTPGAAILPMDYSLMPTAHPIKQGQLTLAGRWFEPRNLPTAQKLNHIHTTIEEVSTP